jgi:hypothetical protein
MTDGGCLIALFAGLAFPFLMFGLAAVAAAVGKRYGGVPAVAVFTAPVWVPIIVALVIKRRAA